MPPKSCLTSKIATALPMTSIHHGAVDGMFIARMTPVTTAERSATAMPTGRLRRRSISASAATAVSVEIARLTSTPAPTKTTWATMPGTSASSTRPIVRCTLTGLRT